MVAHWNLYQLGSALVGLFGETETLQAALDGFLRKVEADSNAMIASKLGLKSLETKADQTLKQDLFAMLTLTETDMTIFFRKLATVPADAGAIDDEALLALVADAYYLPKQVAGEIKQKIVGWLRRYQTRLAEESIPDADRSAKMNSVNPKYVLRNYLAQLAIDKSEAGDHAMVAELLELLRRPYDEQPEFEHYAAKRPDWALSRPGCSMLSCSS